jgi:ABC-type sugar transport system ATPase subunit
MIELQSITKLFPGVRALDNVSFTAQKGEIHALLGENGAGKSTLIKVIAGVYKPDRGVIIYNGTERVWDSPQQSKEAGINVIYQEFNLFTELSVAENIFIAQEPLNRFRFINQQRIVDQSRELLDRLGVCIEPFEKVKNLTVADQQMVEIAKALATQTKVLILDEPTAVISGREVELLFGRLKILRDEGVAIVYISHRLEEIFEIANRVTVLKDGCWVGTHHVKEVDRSKLISMMVGRDLKDIYPPKLSNRRKEVLRAENIMVENKVKDANIFLHESEILGLAGLVGSGRTELAHAIFGSRKMDSGRVTIGTHSYSYATPRMSIESGIGFLTEDRKTEGLVLGMNVRANMTAPTLKRYIKAGLIDFNLERKVCNDQINKYSIAARNTEVKVNNLSGGNQQKVLFSRWVMACGKVLLLDEPTRGVDVGAKVEIYRIIRDLAESGVGILLISSELPEIVGLCNRVVVMREGVVTGELEAQEITEEAIMNLATLKVSETGVCA